MTDTAHLLIRRLMPELHLAYIDPLTQSESIVIFDIDRPDNNDRNFANLPPGTRRLFVSLLELALRDMRRAEAESLK